MSAAYRFWIETMPFRKNGTPVVGTMGGQIRTVIVMEAETFQRMIREHPSLQAASFETPDGAS